MKDNFKPIKSIIRVQTCFFLVQGGKAGRVCFSIIQRFVVMTLKRLCSSQVELKSVKKIKGHSANFYFLNVFLT